MPRPPLDPNILLTTLLKREGEFGLRVDEEIIEDDTLIRRVHLTVNAIPWVKAESRIPCALYEIGAPLYQLASESLGERLKKHGAVRGEILDISASDDAPARQSTFTLTYQDKIYHVVVAEYFLEPSFQWLEAE